MLSKNEIVERARTLGFADIGFTTADPFEPQKQILKSRQEDYAKAFGPQLDLIKGTEPRQLYPEAKSIVALIHTYFDSYFPPAMEAKFGRCYLNDDRILRKGISQKSREFRRYLIENGGNAQFSNLLSDRLSAARAGLGTFGGNSLLYSTRVACKSSWISPVVMMVDREYEPDDPTFEIGCPEWCKNACITACPTGALKGPRHLNPGKLRMKDPGV